jgi:putative endonuclease
MQSGGSGVLPKAFGINFHIEASEKSGAFLFLRMSCYFYILFSRSKDRFYVGHTCEGMAERLRKHNSNHKGFTGGLADWEVVYYEEYSNKTSAYQRERVVKSWKSRKKIEELISN